MGKFYITIILLLSVLSGYSQNPIRDYLDKGDRLILKKEYTEALNLYLEAQTKWPDDATLNFRVGIAYLYLPQKAKALPYLEKAYRDKPDVDDDINYHLGLAYQYNNQFAKGVEQFELFGKKNKKLNNIALQKAYECKVSDSLSRRPLKVLLENIGPIINTPKHEYSPIVSQDGSTLIFTSNRPTDNNPSRGPQEGFEDIYICKKNGNDWSTPQLISPKINIKFNDAAASLSPDGNTLFLYYEQGSGDIFTSTYDGSEWSAPAPLNKNINSPFWETSACISADGNTLYFTSSRPGGFGQLDIYVSKKDSKGEWGKAVNMGSTINTEGNEDAPFIHPDGSTLYFSSDGHPSMGSNDIFITEFKNGAWEIPRNLGYPINSVEYDGFISISADKKTGYYSTIRDNGYGDTDIYSITFLETPDEHDMALLASNGPVIMEKAQIAPVVEEQKTEEPAKIQEVVQTAPVKADEDYADPILQQQRDMKVVTIVRGKVVDEKTALPLEAVITLVDNETNKVLSRIKSKTGTGDFELIIPHGGNYGVATERNGYLFNSINFDLPQFAEYQEIDASILMIKAEVGSKAVLKNVFFDSGKSDLRSQSVAELENLLDLLKENPNLKVQINGHTDNTGDAEANKLLSLKRATAVVNYLIEKGVDSNRLSAVGYGEEHPLVSNDDEQSGREINRRTEIEIIEAAKG